MFKFLHAADIHLDSPLVGLERYDGAPVEQIRQATRRALENLVQLAIDEQVAFVLLAGDLYDRGWRDYATGLHFVAQTHRLKAAGIPVYVIAGNHDAANKMTKILRFQAHVHMLSCDQPETCVLDDLDVAIHGQGFAREAVTHDLSDGYPKADAGRFNIGLLHTCATGTKEHECYAPCTLDGLRIKGYDYWALGHVHKREVLSHDPPIVFPGNVQGRHIRESGPKGCYLVSVSDSREVDLEFRALDVLRWQRCPVNADGVATPEAVLERVQDALRGVDEEGDGLLLAVRVELQGACKAHGMLHGNPQKWINEIRSQALEVGDGRLWVEKVKFLTRPPETASSEEQDGPLAEVRSVLQELRGPGEAFDRLRQELSDLAQKLPPELREASEGVNPDDPDWLRGLLDQVEPLLVFRLLGGKGNE